MKFYDVIKGKEVEIFPERVEVMMMLDSDRDYVIMTKILGHSKNEDDVIVYFGHDHEQAFIERMNIIDKIQEKKEEEENEN